MSVKLGFRCDVSCEWWDGLLFRIAYTLTTPDGRVVDSWEELA